MFCSGKSTIGNLLEKKIAVSGGIGDPTLDQIIYLNRSLSQVMKSNWRKGKKLM